LLLLLLLEERNICETEIEKYWHRFSCADNVSLSIVNLSLLFYFPTSACRFICKCWFSDVVKNNNVLYNPVRPAFWEVDGT